MPSTYPEPQYTGQWSVDRPPTGYVHAGPDVDNQQPQQATLSDTSPAQLVSGAERRDEPELDDQVTAAPTDENGEPIAVDGSRPEKGTPRGGIPKTTPEERQKIKDRWLAACYVPRTTAPRNLRPFATDEMQAVYPPEVKMPPIVGSWLMYANKRVKYNPFPDNIDATRHKLFKMEQPILLKNSQEIADYLPHVTNFWRRSVGRVYIAENGTQVESWGCRSSKPMERKVRSAGKGIRVKKRRVTMFEDQERCKLRLRVLSFTNHAGTGKEHAHWGVHCNCIPEWVYISRECPPGIEHTHGTEIMEKYRKSDAMLYFGRLKVEEGYGYGAVEDWLKQNFAGATEQIDYVSKTDIANMTRPWRQKHPDHPLTLKVEPDAEETMVMRTLVDAVVEAPEDDLRLVLRELCKDSDDTTRHILGLLEERKAKRAEGIPYEAEGELVTQAADTPWQLTEGDLKLLPFPGFPKKFAPSESESSGLEDGYADKVRARVRTSAGKQRQLPVPPNGLEAQRAMMIPTQQGQQQDAAQFGRIPNAQTAQTTPVYPGVMTAMQSQSHAQPAYDPALSIHEVYATPGTPAPTQAQLEAMQAAQRLSQAFAPRSAGPADSPRQSSGQSSAPGQWPADQSRPQSKSQARPSWAQPLSMLPQKRGNDGELEDL